MHPSFPSDPTPASEARSNWRRARGSAGPAADAGPTAPPERAPHPQRDAPSSQRLQPGARVGPYVVVSFLARGGMGEVYEAWEPDLERAVALKLVLAERLDERGRDFFAREARAGARVAHPNLVTTYAHGFDGDQAWIAQEFVPGGWTLKHSLDELRREDRLPPGYYEDVAQLVASLADGLEAAHSAGVVHRDVKPQNVLIAPDDRPMLADFGLARLVGDAFHSITGEAGGTWAYMSPEQVLAQRSTIDHRTDVFSLGVVLYELLSLRRPFEGDTTHQLALEILYSDPPTPRRLRAQCPPELAVICSKAIEKHPDRRYARAADFAADLRRHLAHEPIQARPPGPWQRAGKWLRRHPALGSAALVGSIALVALAGLLALNLRANRDLDLANGDLTVQTEAARQSAALAEKRAGDVLALSAQRDLERLTEEAARLWPPHPEHIPGYEAWLELARELQLGTPVQLGAALPARQSLAGLRVLLGELRREARVVDEPAARRAVEGHPRFGELEKLRVERLWKARMLGLEPWEDLEDVRARVLAQLETEDLDELRYRAWEQVSPRAPRYGGEQEAFVIAEHAAELAGDQRMWVGLWDTIAWTRYRTGDLDGALELAEWNVAQPGGEVLVQSLDWLRRMVAGWRPEEREARLAELTLDDQRIAALCFEVGELVLDDPAEAWWQDQLSELVEGIEELHHPVRGLAGDTCRYEFGWGIERRLRHARELAAQREPGHAARELWLETCAAVADSALYGGLELVPQEGLLPLGPDPSSGLFEFAHLASGEAPPRDADGRLVFTEASAIVLVLLPGGSFWMGAQAEDPRGRNFDPHARSDEAPVHEVLLSPYFIGKHEVDQAQWKRLTNSNHSYYQVSAFASNYLHPEEQVAWIDCVLVLGRFGLRLPSEAQWEHAARGGTSTPWWTGSERESLIGSASIADAAARRAGASYDALVEWPEFDDGAVAHAQVDAFEPNPFGLHGTLGNVLELCDDCWRPDSYNGHARQDPLIRTESGLDRIVRGGAYHLGALDTRSARRFMAGREMRTRYLGVRAARALDRP